MVFIVPKTRPPYPDEFRSEALQMLPTGRSPRELAPSRSGCPGRPCPTGAVRASAIATSATMA